MKFKVVKTIENGDVFIEAVPSGWEREGYLWWPKSGNIDRLRSNSESVPGPDWKVCKCVVLTTADNFGFAVKLEEMFEKVSTESEEEVVHRVPRRKRRAVQSEFVASDYNSLVNMDNISSREWSQSQARHDIPIPPTKNANEPLESGIEENTFEVSGTRVSHENEEEDQNQDAPSMILGSSYSLMQCSCGSSATMQTLSQKVESLQKEVMDFKAKIDKTIQNEAQNSVKLDKILDILFKDNSSYVNCSPNPNASIIEETIEGLPLTTDEALVEFEMKLADRDFKAKFLKYMKPYAGGSGKSDGEKIGFKIIDIVFSRDLLKKYSWTGVTKGAAPKKEFRGNINIITAFCEVVQAADTQYTFLKNEQFFKDKILRHAEARSKIIRK